MGIMRTPTVKARREAAKDGTFFNNKTNRWVTPKGPMRGKRTWNDALSQPNTNRAVKNARPTAKPKLKPKKKVVRQKSTRGYA